MHFSQSQKRRLVSLSINVLVVLSTLVALIFFVFESNSEFMETINFAGLRYFTIDSNILVMLVSILSVFLDVRAIKKGNNEISLAVKLLKFASAICITLTLVTVVVFLGPNVGYDKMFGGTSFVFHLSTPLLVLVNTLFFDFYLNLSVAKQLTALVPVALYGAVYYVMVIALEKWYDFYGFNKDGKWFVTVIVMALGVTFMSLIIGIAEKYIKKQKGE